MPENVHFGFNVIIGSEPLWEYTASDNKVYIESNIMCGQSYEMPSANGQVNVTPYKIIIETQKNVPPRFYKIYVDGKYITRCFIRGWQTRTITGFRSGNQMKEFVFSFPVESQDEKKTASKPKFNKEIGEIKIMAYEALDTGEDEIYYKCSYKKVDRDCNGSPLKPSFTKSDCTKVTDGRFPLYLTAAGKTVEISEKENRPHRRRRRQLGPLVSSITLHYRPRLALQVLGIIQPENSSTIPILVSDVGDDKEKEEKLEDGTNDPNQSQPIATDIVMADSKEDKDKIEDATNVQTDGSQLIADFATDIDMPEVICVDKMEAEENCVSSSHQKTADIDTESKADDTSDMEILSLQDLSIDKGSMIKSPGDQSPLKHKASPQAIINDQNDNFITPRKIKKENLVDDEDDEELWAEDEPSIIWEGDDECYITMVRRPWEHTMICLSDEEETNITDKSSRCFQLSASVTY